MTDSIQAFALVPTSSSLQRFQGFEMSSPENSPTFNALKPTTEPNSRSTTIRSFFKNHIITVSQQHGHLLDLY